MQKLEQKSTSLGLELGSTRIKAVLAGPDGTVLASGAHDWQNRFEGGYWTYHLDEVWTGVQHALRDLARNYEAAFGEPLRTVGALGVSAMMHGYLPFDRQGRPLTAFRTWRNTTTRAAAEALTERFRFNIPQRWTVAHFYQAILNGEDHVRQVDFLTTLAGYLHWQLTGQKVLGIGDASGVFPIDSRTCDYDAGMLASFDELLAGALGVPVSVMQTAGEGGPWGMALLAGYRLHRAEGETLEQYLHRRIFAGAVGSTVQPDARDSRGFAAFMKQYIRCLAVERAAIDALP